MVKYDFALLNFFSHSTNSITCTNTDQLDNLIAKILELESQINPSTMKDRKIHIIREEWNGPFHIRVANVERYDLLNRWLIKWFCDNGWEPFSNNDGIISFRRIQD